MLAGSAADVSEMPSLLCCDTAEWVELEMVGCLDDLSRKAKRSLSKGRHASEEKEHELYSTHVVALRALNSHASLS